MKKSIIVVAVLLSIVGLVWYLSLPEPITVATERVTLGEVRATVTNTRAGTVHACRRARLAPPIGGQIESLNVREGDQVEAGTILLELWNDDLAAEVVLAERDHAASGASAEEVCVTANVAEKEANRLTRLHQQGLSSEEDADRAVGEARATAAACKAARSLIEVKNSRVAVVRAALERTRLRAPFDGTVAEINGELGEFVTPSPVGIPTPPAVDLIDNSCLYITAPIDEVDAPAVEAGMPALIAMDAFPAKRFPGVVRRVAPYVLDIEKQARTVEIEAEIENPAEIRNLLPGYSADVEVVLSVRENVVRVPTQALFNGNKIYVYDVDTGLVTQRGIEAGISNWEFTEVMSGLQSGETVVTSIDREGLADGVTAKTE